MRERMLLAALRLRSVRKPFDEPQIRRDEPPLEGIRPVPFHRNPNR